MTHEQTIWKYEIDTFTKEVEVPEGGQILDVQMQGKHPCLWILVDPAQCKKTRLFHLIGTGHPILSSTLDYIGTVQIDALVWHLFEGKSD